MEFEPKLPLTFLSQEVEKTKQGLQWMSKKANCLYRKSEKPKSLFFAHDQCRAVFDFGFKNEIIISHVCKGGTGKTTTLLNLSALMCSLGARILVIDIDAQGNITDSLLKHSKYNIDDFPVVNDILEKESDFDIKDAIIPVCKGFDLIGSRIENVILDSTIEVNRLNIQFALEDIINPIRDNYDFIFIDCPPQISKIVSSAYAIADKLLITINPNAYSVKALEIIKKEKTHIEKQFRIPNIKYKVLLNKFNGQTLLSDAIANNVMVSEYQQGNALLSTIPQCQEIENLASNGLSVYSVLKKLPIKNDYLEFAKEFLNFDLKEYRGLSRAK